MTPWVSGLKHPAISQTYTVSRHGDEQAQTGTSRNSKGQNQHLGRFSPSQPGRALRLLDKCGTTQEMVASSSGARTQARRDLPFLLAETRLASTGQVYNVRQREDARFHMEVGP